MALSNDTIDIIEKKIIGMGVYRYRTGERPIISMGEFKYIITRYWTKKTMPDGTRLSRHLKKKDWWEILKELEKRGVVKMPSHKRHIIVLMNGLALKKFEIKFSH